MKRPLFALRISLLASIQLLLPNQGHTSTREACIELEKKYQFLLGSEQLKYDSELDEFVDRDPDSLRERYKQLKQVYQDEVAYRRKSSNTWKTLSLDNITQAESLVTGNCMGWEMTRNKQLALLILGLKKFKLKERSSIKTYLMQSLKNSFTVPGPFILGFMDHQLLLKMQQAQLFSGKKLKKKLSQTSKQMTHFQKEAQNSRKKHTGLLDSLKKEQQFLKPIRRKILSLLR